MDLWSARTHIRLWEYRDDERANHWPPYNDPFDSLWNLPRYMSSNGIWSNLLSDSRQSYAVEDRAHQLIGRISLREIDPDRRQARLGVTFGAPFVSRGLGTESLHIFIDYYFEHMGFDSMVLDVAAPNRRAVRCYERLGFSYVSSDWRRINTSFNPRILYQPRYAELARYFIQRRDGLYVEFFEMSLHYNEWRTRHASQAYDGGV
jgi:RimJ/RimL family protein N-acetyltransferase